MIDYQNLPDNSKVDWFMQPTTGNELHTWNKPSGCNFIYMLAVGGGAFGGNGFSGAAGTARGGGGGGSCGQLCTLIVPAFLVPDSLYIKVGSGGIRSTSTNGTSTVISAYRTVTGSEIYLTAGGGNNGGNGSGSAPGSGGTTTTPGIPNSTLGTIGKWQGLITLGGSAAGAIAGAAGVVATFNYILSGGAGGGSTTSGDFAGGDITSAYGQVSALTVVKGGAAVANATSGQNDGGNGYFIPKRFASYGGAGGGASNNGVGGNGGKGGPGSGGGGGGAGITGGLGGDGGDGFAVIISY